MIENINIIDFIALSSILFAIGLCGIFINKNNLITILMSIELMLLSVNINMVAFSAYSGDLIGQIFSIFILVVAGAEAAIGLAILITYYNNHNSASSNIEPLLKG